MIRANSKKPEGKQQNFPEDKSEVKNEVKGNYVRERNYGKHM